MKKLMNSGSEDSENSLVKAQVQMPFRCSRDFSTRLIRAKGSMMRITGEKVSDNRFFQRLLEIGLKEIERQYEPGL
jgi:hypothetical protein